MVSNELNNGERLQFGYMVPIDADVFAALEQVDHALARWVERDKVTSFAYFPPSDYTRRGLIVFGQTLDRNDPGHNWSDISHKDERLMKVVSSLPFLTKIHHKLNLAPVPEESAHRPIREHPTSAAQYERTRRVFEKVCLRMLRRLPLPEVIAMVTEIRRDTTQDCRPLDAMTISLAKTYSEMLADSCLSLQDQIDRKLSLEDRAIANQLAFEQFYRSNLGEPHKMAEAGSPTKSPVVFDELHDLTEEQRIAIAEKHAQDWMNRPMVANCSYQLFDQDGKFAGWSDEDVGPDCVANSPENS